MRRTVWIVITALLLLCYIVWLVLTQPEPVTPRSFGEGAVQETAAGDEIAEAPREDTEKAAASSDAAAAAVRNKQMYIACGEYRAELAAAHYAAAEADPQEIAGAILPHYAPAMYMAADLYSDVRTPPDTIVVAGPNHAAIGGPVQICGTGYVWPEGTMDGDEALASQLAAALGLTPDDTAAREDWSVSQHMPYLGRYFPDARVVSILLSRGADEASLAVIADLLAEIAGTRQLLVVGSADFSHYQDERTAHACDEETARAIESRDLPQLLRFGNEHADSPETIVLILRYAEALGLSLDARGGLFETFMENGAPMAGSYYAYAVK